MFSCSEGKMSDRDPSSSFAGNHHQRIVKTVKNEIFSQRRPCFPSFFMSLKRSLRKMGRMRRAANKEYGAGAIDPDLPGTTGSAGIMIKEI
jgi:hypothetical protein